MDIVYGDREKFGICALSIESTSKFVCALSNVMTSTQRKRYIYIYIWDSVQQNHPYDTFSNFQHKQKKSNARIEMYG